MKKKGSVKEKNRRKNSTTSDKIRIVERFNEKKNAKLNLGK